MKLKLKAESTAKCFEEGKREEKRRAEHLGDVVRSVWRRLTSLTIKRNFSHSMNVCGKIEPRLAPQDCLKRACNQPVIFQVYQLTQQLLINSLQAL